ncbi:9455_t:CDS:1, partial [Funneliformis geosporum]
IQLYKKHGDNSGYSMLASTGFYSKNVWDTLALVFQALEVYM